MFRPNRLLGLIAASVSSFFLAMPGPASAQDTFTATGIINPTGVGFLGSFDITVVDSTLGVMLLADRSNGGITIVDTFNNTIGVIGAGKFVTTGANVGPNGVITVGHTVWAGDGDGTIKVFDVFSGASIVTINALNPATGKLASTRADELCYDPVRNLVLMAWDRENFVSIINALPPYNIVKQIRFDGTDPNGAMVNATAGIEQCQWSPRTKKFYLNIPEVNGPGDGSFQGGVVVIDVDPAANPADFTKMKVVAGAQIPKVSGCTGNQGMAIGPAPQILLGCSNRGNNSVIIDENSLQVIQVLAGEHGADEVWYNPGDNHYFLALSNHKGGCPLLGVVDANEFQALDNGGCTAAGSHTVSVDPVFNQVYVPVQNGTGAASGLCTSLGGDSSKGCIAIYTRTKSDPIPPPPAPSDNQLARQ